jgi:hypothetical protein
LNKSQKFDEENTGQRWVPENSVPVLFSRLQFPLEVMRPSRMTIRIVALFTGRLHPSMDFLNDFIQKTQLSALQSAQQVLEEAHIKEDVIGQLQDFAQKIVNDEPVEVFHPVPIDSVSELTEYCLVMDYLESIGLKFAPTVMRYESQHPNQFADRTELAQRLHLRSYDKTPLLVQIIEEKRKWLQRSRTQVH